MKIQKKFEITRKILTNNSKSVESECKSIYQFNDNLIILPLAQKQEEDLSFSRKLRGNNELPPLQMNPSSPYIAFFRVRVSQNQGFQKYLETSTNFQKLRLKWPLFLIQRTYTIWLNLEKMPNAFYKNILLFKMRLDISLSFCMKRNILQ